ncbi:MAG: hypothetical protein LBM73_00410 [Candidatus Nomurabacteria bacterium]|jgi:hypothetical protein|nr:hypothetical protein [Candidatus Nomurabacteria bacterium]
MTEVRNGWTMVNGQQPANDNDLAATDLPDNSALTNPDFIETSAPVADPALSLENPNVPPRPDFNLPVVPVANSARPLLVATSWRDWAGRGLWLVAGGILPGLARLLQTLLKNWFCRTPDLARLCDARPTLALVLSAAILTLIMFGLAIRLKLRRPIMANLLTGLTLGFFAADLANMNLASAALLAVFTFSLFNYIARMRRPLAANGLMIIMATALILAERLL